MREPYLSLAQWILRRSHLHGRHRRILEIKYIGDFLGDGNAAKKVITAVDKRTGEVIILNAGKHVI